MFGDENRNGILYAFVAVQNEKCIETERFTLDTCTHHGAQIILVWLTFWLLQGRKKRDLILNASETADCASTAAAYKPQEKPHRQAQRKAAAAGSSARHARVRGPRKKSSSSRPDLHIC